MCVACISSSEMEAGRVDRRPLPVGSGRVGSVFLSVLIMGKLGKFQFRNRILAKDLGCKRPSLLILCIYYA